jgi:hypothetical protein
MRKRNNRFHKRRTFALTLRHPLSSSRRKTGTKRRQRERKFKTILDDIWVPTCVGMTEEIVMLGLKHNGHNFADLC